MELLSCGAWPLPMSLRSKLASAGYLTLSTLQNTSPSALARDIQVSQEEALHILKILREIDGASATDAKMNLLAGAKTAWDLLCHEKSRRRITTSSDELDGIFGGGISCKEVTEICGAPGVGKTQLGIQLAVNVQIPRDFGGVGGHAVYIDTEGSFMVERALQVAQACVARINMAAMGAGETHVDVDSFLSHIFYFRISNCTEQIAVVNHLEGFLASHKEVKIIIIDSITFHFRHGFEDMALRTRLLGGMGQKLMRIAEVHDVAIVLMNQITTKFIGGSARLVPALGEYWSHACTNRVILYWMNGERKAHMFKSPSLRSATAPFSISLDGICGVESHKRMKSS